METILKWLTSPEVIWIGGVLFGAVVTNMMWVYKLRR